MFKHSHEQVTAGARLRWQLQSVQKTRVKDDCLCNTARHVIECLEFINLRGNIIIALTGQESVEVCIYTLVGAGKEKCSVC